MSNPSRPDQPDEATDETDDTQQAEAVSDPEHEPVTEILLSPEAEAQLPAEETNRPPERRFTAPSAFDAGSTQKIDTPAEPATEVMMPVPTESMAQERPVAPQAIPPRTDPGKPPRNRRSWGWVVAVLLVIAALVAVAILGTLLLTRGSTPKVSQEDMVRSTIQNFDERAWTETHARVAVAKQYPVVASIDQVVVNGDHAEANVTTFMAYAPQTRSTRSFDLQFRDEQWKICQAPDS